MGISENIKRRRLELRLSQQELADKMGYKSRSTIAKIESGENCVPESRIPWFAKALDTTVDYIKNGAFNKVTYRSIENTENNEPHKNVVVVLAGGKSSRNMQNIPNQFISVLGKPVIIYCLEAYQHHPAIDDIYVVCLKGWEGILRTYARQYGIEKLRGIIQAGDTGIQSVYYGVNEIWKLYEQNDIVIFQEATRPLITEEMISKLLYACIRKGSAITCEPMEEFLQFELDIELNKEEIEASSKGRYLNRHRIITAESPEAYRLGTILEAFRTANDRGHKLDETCFAMLLYNLGYDLQFYEGNHNNIKVVRQEDIAILSALLRNRF